MSSLNLYGLHIFSQYLSSLNLFIFSHLSYLQTTFFFLAKTFCRFYQISLTLPIIRPLLFKSLFTLSNHRWREPISRPPSTGFIDRWFTYKHILYPPYMVSPSHPSLFVFSFITVSLRSRILHFSFSLNFVTPILVRVITHIFLVFFLLDVKSFHVHRLLLSPRSHRCT